MNDHAILLPIELYTQQHLSTINNIDFTPREIDVMACILSVRDDKSIASILNIKPTTVRTHIRNVMLKIESNSKAGIIEFIQNSDKFLALKNYYTHLLVQDVFITTLPVSFLKDNIWSSF